MADLEIEKLIALSSAHVDRVTMEMIAEHDAGVIAYPNEYGAFLWIGELFVLDPEKTPEDLAAVIEFARRQDCDWIKLDRDGQVSDELKTYDW
jgi:hypothetical protein